MNNAFMMDSTSILMASISPLVFMLLCSMAFSGFPEVSNKLFMSVFLYIISMVSLCFMTSSQVLFLIFIELTALPMVFLILCMSKDSDKISSACFMFIMNLMGSIPFLFYIFQSSEQMFDYLGPLVMFIHIFSDSYLLGCCFLLVLVCKLPMFFFHFWLTKAHVSSAGSCSMLLASLMLKMGSFGLVKYSFLFCSSTLTGMKALVSLSVTGCFYFCLHMIRFFDVKVLVACSSIVHMALLLPLTVHGESKGIVGSLYMMSSHGLVSYILFYLITLMYEGSHNRSMDFNKSLESVSKLISMVLFIFLFINLSVPPLINFMSEVYFCSSLYSFSWWPLILFMLVMMLSILFTMFICAKSLFGKKNYAMGSELSNSVPLNSFMFVIFLSILPFFL